MSMCIRKTFSHLEEEPLEIQASQEYEGIPFNDDTAKIVLSLEKNDNDYSITKYMQTHLSDIEQLREKDGTVYRRGSNQYIVHQ